MGDNTRGNGKWRVFIYMLYRIGKKRDGLGIMFWQDGTKYEGQFKADYSNGYGRKLFANGEHYLGHFAHDKANGQGVFKDLNGG